MILLRALARVVAFLVLLVLALLGLAVALGAIDPSGAAKLARLPAVSERVGDYLDGLPRARGVGVTSLLVGLGAIALGILLLLGSLVPRRERVVVLRETGHGRLAARRRPLGQVAQVLAEQARGVTEAHAKVKPRRRGGGTVRVTASRPKPVPERDAEQAVAAQLEDLTGPFALKPRVRTKVGERGARVQ